MPGRPPTLGLYRHLAAARDIDRRVAAAAARIRGAPRVTFADDGPHRYRHGWIRIDADGIRNSDSMKKMLETSFPIADRERGDLFLGDIVRQNGFDAHPRVVGPDELQKAIDGGGVEMWRGMQDPKHAEGFKTGAYYPGGGQYGSGYYAVAVVAPGEGRSESAKKEAGAYGKSFIRMALSPQAKTITLDEIGPRQQADVDKMPVELAALQKQKEDGKIDQAEFNKGIVRLATWNAVIRDPGRWAALNGYDAIVVGNHRFGDGHDESVVLNRGALLVDGSV